MRLAPNSKSKMSAEFSRLNSDHASLREIWPPFKIRSPSRAIWDRGFASTSFTIMVDRLTPEVINASGDSLDPAPVANRPAGNALFDHLTDDVLARDRPESAAVGAVVAIVAHDEKFVIADANELTRIPFVGIGWCFGRKIGFTQQLAIDINPAVFEINRLSRHGDDAFDLERIIARVFQSDDVVLSRLAYDIGEPVQPIMSRVGQGGIHAGAFHLNGLNDVMGDQQIAQCSQAGQNYQSPALQ
jgi:hypothetical protein